MGNQNGRGAAGEFDIREGGSEGEVIFTFRKEEGDHWPAIRGEFKQLKQRIVVLFICDAYSGEHS